MFSQDYVLPGGTKVTARCDLPFAFLQFYEVGMISENSIRLYDWPEGVYGGKFLSHGMGKIFIADLPRVAA